MPVGATFVGAGAMQSFSHQELFPGSNPQLQYNPSLLGYEYINMGGDTSEIMTLPLPSNLRIGDILFAIFALNPNRTGGTQIGVVPANPDQWFSNIDFESSTNFRFYYRFWSEGASADFVALQDSGSPGYGASHVDDVVGIVVAYRQAYIISPALRFPSVFSGLPDYQNGNPPRSPWENEVNVGSLYASIVGPPPAQYRTRLQEGGGAIGITLYGWAIFRIDTGREPSNGPVPTMPQIDPFVPAITSPPLRIRTSGANYYGLTVADSASFGSFDDLTPARYASNSFIGATDASGNHDYDSGARSFFVGSSFVIVLGGLGSQCLPHDQASVANTSSRVRTEDSISYVRMSSTGVVTASENQQHPPCAEYEQASASGTAIRVRSTPKGGN